MIEQSLPNKLSIVFIPHRIKMFSRHCGLENKMILAAREQKPQVIITPPYSFIDQKEFLAAYQCLRKESKGAALITGRTREWIEIPDLKPKHVLKHLIYEVVVKPGGPQTSSDLDLLINMGPEDVKELIYDTKNLKNNGFFIRCKGTRSYVLKKDNNYRLVLQHPEEHKHMKEYDLYILKFDK